MSSSLFVVLAVACLLSVVYAQERHFNGRCESGGTVWECPAFNFTEHGAYQIRHYDPITGFGVFIPNPQPPVDFIALVDALYLPLFYYTNGSNAGNVNINRTLPVAMYADTRSIAEVWYFPRAYSSSAPAPSNRSVMLSPPGGALPPFGVFVHRFLQGNRTVDSDRISAELRILDAALDADKRRYVPDFEIINWYDLPDVKPAESQRFEVARLELGNEEFINDFRHMVNTQKTRARRANMQTKLDGKQRQRGLHIASN